MGSVDANVALCEAAIADALGHGANVIVLPELATSGYEFASQAEARDSTITRDSSLFARWAELAAPAVLVFGCAELAEDGTVYNSAALLEYDRVPVVYRKTHLWDAEHLFFTPGGEAPPVAETRVGRVAMMVCYDAEIPEMTRSVALRGAELLTVPTNWPFVARPDGQPAPEIVIAMAAARVNRMAIALCDRTGNDRGQRWNGESTIVAADGWPVATVDAEGFVVADLDLASRSKVSSDWNDWHTDLRPDIYR